MHHPSPTPDVVARRLLADLTRAQDQSPADLAVAADQVYRHLHDHLVVVLGPNGVDALWARALLLAQRAVRSRDRPTEPAPGPASGLPAAVQGLDLLDAQRLVIAAFTACIDLLYLFLGQELGFRLVQRAWSESVLDETVSPDEERTA